MSTYYTKDHVWIRAHEKVYRVGLSTYAQQELGEVVFVEAVKGGKKVEKGAVVCSIDSLKSTSDIYAPASGTIVEGNVHASEENAAIVNSDPLGEGWLFSMTVENPKELDELMSEDEYAAFIG